MESPSSVIGTLLKGRDEFLADLQRHCGRGA